jgi:hypothetical protein
MMETTIPNARRLDDKGVLVIEDKIVVSGPYVRSKIEFWIDRCDNEHQLSSLKRVLTPLTAEQKLLPTSTHSMGAG